jgi:hypothetical protein
MLEYCTLDWYVCRNRCIPCRDRPGPEAVQLQLGHARTLFLERHTASHRQPPERKTTHIYTLPGPYRCQPTSVHSFRICGKANYNLAFVPDFSTLGALFERWVHQWALRFFLLTDRMRRRQRRSPEK